MPDESPPLDTAENAPEQQEASVGRVPVPTQAQLDARRVYRRAHTAVAQSLSLFLTISGPHFVSCHRHRHHAVQPGFCAAR